MAKGCGKSCKYSRRMYTPYLSIQSSFMTAHPAWACAIPVNCFYWHFENLSFTPLEEQTQNYSKLDLGLFWDCSFLIVTNMVYLELVLIDTSMTEPERKTYKLFMLIVNLRIKISGSGKLTSCKFTCIFHVPKSCNRSICWNCIKESSFFFFPVLSFRFSPFYVLASNRRHFFSFQIWMSCVGCSISRCKGYYSFIEKIIWFMVRKLQSKTSWSIVSWIMV